MIQLFRSVSRICSLVIIPTLLLQIYTLHAAEPQEKQTVAAVELVLSELESCKVRQSGDGKYLLFCHDAPMESLSNEQFAVLRKQDELLQRKHDAISATQSRAIIEVLARTGNDNALSYVHEVFESAPERRNAVAQALSYYAQERKLRDSDWRLLVRSLNVVEGAEAGDVIRALQRFRRRANKAQWIRQLIRVGLQLTPADQKEAVKLLQHWTSQKMAISKSSEQELMNWQSWFAKKYPDELPAVLPVDAKTSLHKFTQLRTYLQAHRHDKHDLKQGEQVFKKAKCFSCHLVGQTGEKIGPKSDRYYEPYAGKRDSGVILFPSQFVPEEYPTSVVLTQSGKQYTGMMGAADRETLVILQADGKKQLIKKTDVELIKPSKLSAMPENLLNGLTREEIAQIFAYLRANATGKSAYHPPKR